jgi:hypothetical protein
MYYLRLVKAISSLRSAQCISRGAGATYRR